MTLSRVFGSLCAVTLALTTLPAHAQLGSVNNPPPQHLFNTDQPQRLDNGLGTMAERRSQLGRIRNGQRVRASRHRVYG